MEKLINYISRASFWKKKISVVEVTFSRRPQNHKNINVVEKLLVSPTQIVIIKCSLSSYEKKKIVVHAKAAVFEKFASQADALNIIKGELYQTVLEI